MLETPRLLMRQFNLDDLPDYFRLGSDPEVTLYVGNEPFTTLEEARRVLIDAPLRDYEEYGFGRLAVIEKESGRLIGFNGLKYLPEIDEIDIGYRFFKDCWGKGYATESSIEVMKYGREDLDLKRIVAIADRRNTASLNVIRKLGLRFEKKVRFGTMKDMDLYS